MMGGDAQGAGVGRVAVVVCVVMFQGLLFSCCVAGIIVFVWSCCILFSSGAVVWSHCFRLELLYGRTIPVVIVVCGGQCQVGAVRGESERGIENGIDFKSVRYERMNAKCE